MSPEPSSRIAAAFPPDRPIVCYVTDGRSLEDKFDLLQVIFALPGFGVDWIQIREKEIPAGELLELTRHAIHAANSVSDGAATRARIIVNDRLDVAVAAGAAGVHLGRQSIPIVEAVTWCKESCRVGRLATDFIIGASSHSLDESLAAERDGANYIFFGPIFDTPSKRTFGDPQGLDRLNKVCAAVKIPVIAIGGINERNAPSCINAGASGIAAIRMFQETSNQEQLRQFIANFHAL